MADKTVTVTVDAAAAHEVLDSLLTKAERLTKLLDGINVLEKAEQALPPIQYTINLGNIKDLMNAPEEAFSKEFIEEFTSVFFKIANAKPKKEIDLTNSNNYKATKGVA